MKDCSRGRAFRDETVPNLFHLHRAELATVARSHPNGIRLRFLRADDQKIRVTQQTRAAHLGPELVAGQIRVDAESSRPEPLDHPASVLVALFADREDNRLPGREPSGKIAAA